MDSGVSALDQFQQDLNVIGNNIANVDTVGFKSSNMQFANALSQTIGDNAAGVEQIGTGVLTSSIAATFTQGSIVNTQVPTNMAINGNGFFMVKDPARRPDLRDTRWEFLRGCQWITWVSSTGMRVQGLTTAGGTTVGDIQISNANAPGGDTSPVQSYTFASNGNVNILLADGTQFTSSQIVLQNFTAPTQLVSVGNNLYTGQTNAGQLAAPLAADNEWFGERSSAVHWKCRTWIWPPSLPILSQRNAALKPMLRQ